MPWAYGQAERIMQGLDNIKMRLQHHGGGPLGRISDGKVRSLKAAFANSYQSAKIINLADDTEYTGLINPDRLKPDYDNKILSTLTEAGFNAGSTFYWPANGTYWIVLLQELTETAYFRGYIRRCKNSITINDTDYYIYIQGPTETDIKWNQKAGITWSKLNHSLLMYITKNDDTLDTFKRFSVIELDGQNWRVEAVDAVSMEGLIEVNLEEFFNNSLEDLQEIPVVDTVDITLPHIVGEVFVKPYDILEYSIALATGGTWTLDSDIAEIVTSDESSATVEVTTGKRGTFELAYERTGETPITLTVTIESL